MRAIIFDLDATIYTSREIGHFLQGLFAELSGQTREAFDAARRELQAADPSTGGSNIQTLWRRFGVSPKAWHDAAEGRFPASALDHLEVPAGYANRFTRLAKRFALHIWTNNTRGNSERILARLGLRASFQRLFTLTDLVERGQAGDHIAARVKPSVVRAREIVAELALPAGDCLMVGDRHDVDLAPAEAIGMPTRLVGGPSDVAILLDGLLV